MPIVAIIGNAGYKRGFAMSFAYAQRISNSIAIFADTKITFTYGEAKLLWGEATQYNIENFGLIKNIKIGNHLCISFAGNNLVWVNEFLGFIKNIPVSEIIKLALEIHMRDIQNGVDFIICYADEKQQDIFEVKNGTCKRVDFSWIGSYTAFNYFQGVKTKNISTEVNTNNPDGVEITFGYSSQSPVEVEYQRLFNTFHKVIFDCGDTAVGGFVIPLIYDHHINSFRYHEYMKNYTSLEYKNGTAHLPMYQSAEFGAYSILFYSSTSIVGLFLAQPRLGVIYNQHRADARDYINRGTSELFLPQVTKMNQLDFYIQTEAKGLSPPGFLGCEPDNIDEIFKRINTYRENPSMALIYINKIIEIIQTQHCEENRLDEFLSIKSNIESSL